MCCVLAWIACCIAAQSASSESPADITSQWRAARERITSVRRCDNPEAVGVGAPLTWGSGWVTATGATRASPRTELFAFPPGELRHLYLGECVYADSGAAGGIVGCVVGDRVITRLPSPNWREVVERRAEQCKAERELSTADLEAAVRRLRGKTADELFDAWLSLIESTTPPTPLDPAEAAYFHVLLSAGIDKLLAGPFVVRMQGAQRTLLLSSSEAKLATSKHIIVSVHDDLGSLYTLAIVRRNTPGSEPASFRDADGILASVLKYGASSASSRRDP